MSIFFIENRQDPDDPNQLPSRRQMDAAGLYWNFLGSILDGIGTGRAESENERIVALRKNAEHFERQRQPSIVSEIVTEAIDRVLAVPVVRPIKRAVAKAATAKQRAEAWLVKTLSGQLGGQLAAVELERLAKAAGISLRTLRRAAESAGIRHVKNTDKTWSWRLIQAKGRPSAAP
jgi:hypothetical protein